MAGEGVEAEDERERGEKGVGGEREGGGRERIARSEWDCPLTIHKGLGSVGRRNAMIFGHCRDFSSQGQWEYDLQVKASHLSKNESQTKGCLRDLIMVL
eukprot:470550-Hanusia_phi.AAC.5